MHPDSIRGTSEAEAGEPTSASASTSNLQTEAQTQNDKVPPTMGGIQPYIQPTLEERATEQYVQHGLALDPALMRRAVEAYIKNQEEGANFTASQAARGFAEARQIDANSAERLAATKRTDDDASESRDERKKNRIFLRRIGLSIIFVSTILVIYFLKQNNVGFMNISHEMIGKEWWYVFALFFGIGIYLGVTFLTGLGFFGVVTYILKSIFDNHK